MRGPAEITAAKVASAEITAAEVGSGKIVTDTAFERVLFDRAKIPAECGKVSLFRRGSEVRAKIGFKPIAALLQDAPQIVDGLVKFQVPVFGQG